MGLLILYKHRGEGKIMKSLYIADVGDGLCMRLDTHFNRRILIDCGSGQGGKRAFDGFSRIFHYCSYYRNHFENPDIFILSHFHSDHYNGIFNMKEKSINLKDLYYPGIPEFKKKSELMMAFLCMSARVLGNDSETVETDFIKTMQNISSEDFYKNPLYRGDNININGLRIDILWPPRELKCGKITKAVERAIKDFEEAKKEDEPLDKIYSKIEESNKVSQYLSREREYIKSKSNERDSNTNNKKPSSHKELLGAVKIANESLRNVANSLSLSFAIDDRFLFLGDLEKDKIGQVVSKLNLTKRNNFMFFITPHHGTHWDESLWKIRCKYALSSNGISRIKKFKHEFKDISNFHFATFTSGDIFIPIHCPYCLPPFFNEF